MTERVISVGVSRLFRLIERTSEGALDPSDRVSTYRVEQALRDPLTKKWKWKPLCMATQWNEGHGALHQVQAECMDAMRQRQGSFNAQSVGT